MAHDDDLDALVKRVDPDRWLSSRFIADPLARADVVALYAFDHELARAPKVASNPLLGEIRLTWWREVLDEIFEGRRVRHHPTAQALATVVHRRRLAREPLEAMIDARYRELDAQPMTQTEALEWARDTAGNAALLAASIADPGAQAACASSGGAVWTLRRRLAARGDLHPAMRELMAKARLDARRLTAAAFPAVAHAALVDRPGASELTRRLTLMWAVALGRI